MNSTFFMCKPDAVERGLVGEIIRRIEITGLKFSRIEMRVVDEATAKAHYAEHEGKSFFGELIEFITRSPVVVCEVTGPENTWEIVRKIMGSTNPASAAPGTIRGDLANSISANLVHGSDSAESAARELANFFPSR
ncbi:MAG: nucleoside-diphosphate kinase [Actinomycetota bacterium]|nr:nucleoside-diphosphate kinase [Actinomycetota bacterium]